MEVDDLLIDLSASIAEVVNSVAVYIQGDAVRPHILKESNVIISDLPIGYYPNDEIASRFKVAATGEHTYAHHILYGAIASRFEERWYCYFWHQPIFDKPSKRFA